MNPSVHERLRNTLALWYGKVTMFFNFLLPVGQVT